MLVDGRALASCVVPARQCQGRSVITLEGLAPRERHVFAHAFSVTGGLQLSITSPLTERRYSAGFYAAGAEMLLFARLRRASRH